ncbi:RHS repeat-associated protein [Saccharothrix coeruleofusca]|uniref:LamG-like jellyroll fold domain-containing protein n=1 Tax=Saccharothrix coeruleofusca TaxID=33919 RepID=UPI001FD5B1D4|nr:LamG-like jellyroll fold domain-containing protein [Saccharothrix coeruleofusca]MBP2336565.1 RHS repeat-associated protein [Saccharothrix coeruleofusca]
MLFLPAGGVKFLAIGLTVAVLAGGTAGDAVLGGAGPVDGSVLSALRGPDQLWGSAAAAAAAGHVEGKPDNRTLPESIRGRYPKQVWDQKVDNTVEEVEAPVARTTGYDAATSKEIPEARTAHERVYTNADGTQTTEFSTAKVNYRAADGSWKPVDPSLVADPGKGWRNAADEVDVRLAGQSGGDLVTLTVDQDHSVSYSLAGANRATATADGTTVTYPGVLPGVDLRVESVPSGAKETLVLAGPDAPTEYLFPLTLKGLTPSVVDGEVVFADASGARRAVIPPGDMVDAKSARSTGVSYRLVTSGGAPALQVSVDGGWLREPGRAFPVSVDPTVKLPVAGDAADSSMYVSGGASSPGGNDFSIGPNAAAYLRFGGLVSRLQHHTIFGAQLWAVNYEAESCNPRQVTVHPVTSSWVSDGDYSYPGPSVGGALASKSFAHGYIAFGQSSSACPRAGELFNLGSGGRDLVQRWVDGEQANHGLSLRGTGAKKFTGPGTANPPKLFVTHSPYNATYKLADPVPKPPVLQNQDGKVKITVTNRSAAAWAPGDYYLAYRAYKADTGASVVQQRAANLTSTVARGGKVTLEATIKALPPGKYFLDFTMVRSGGPVFTDHQVPPGRIVLQVFDIPPVVQELFPPNGFRAPTLTPQLWARALDIDAPPSSSLQFKFEVCESDAAGKPVNCVNSGYQAKTAWTVPAGTLRWSRTYQWRAFVKDATTEVPSPYSVLLAQVPQPEITSRIAGAPYSDQNQDFDPRSGNHTTSAVDATAATVGPQLTLTRTYNSLDPRRDGLFGAGWSTSYDMKVVPDDDGSGNVVVTYPDGQAVRFGRNADGTYAAPPGRTASLTSDSTSWKLLDKSGTTYQFATTGKLNRITDVANRSLVLTYAEGKLSKVQASVSQTSTAGRALLFTWTGNHVTSVRTDPVDGTALTWNYTYDGDVLKKVCAPGSACTGYDYSAGSHYRSAVLDARPESYWRLGDTEGTAASSEVAVNLGKDVGTYKSTTPSTETPLAGTTDQSTAFNGSTSAVELPKGTLKKSRDAAVELWFKNNPSGSGGPLLGYQDKALGSASTTGVPVLYVGTDGKLRGQFATGSISPITSAATVNDGRWHHVVLSSMGSTQTLYLDGAKVGELTGKTVDHALLTFNQIGAAYAGTPASWPAWGATAQRSYNGTIDEVSLYAGPLGAASVAAHYKAATAKADQLAKVTLPSGRVAATATYDVSRDRLKEYTDADGGTWRIGAPAVYGGDTDLRRSVEVLDPAGRPSLYEYDAIGGWLLRYGLPLGVEARSEDEPGEPAPSEPEPVETCTQPDPNDPAFCTTIPDDSGGPVFVRYGTEGTSIRAFSYDDNGNLTTVTDENGDSTWLTYDARGNVTSTKTCRTATVCHTSYKTYPATITNQYDPRNDLPVESRDGRSAGPTDNTYRTSYSYHFTGQLASQTNPDNSTTSNTYTNGSEVAVGGGSVPAGLLAGSTNGRGKVTRFAYYANGDLARITHPNGLVREYTYDALGRRTTEKEISDSFPSGVVTTFTYDGMSRPRTTTGPVTTNPISGVKHQLRTTTDYDADGNPTRVERADLLGGDQPRVTTTDYDEHGRPLTVTDAEGGETGYDHDAFGNVTSVTDPNGNRFDMAYTARNALAEVRLRDWRSDPPGAPAPGTGDYLVLNSYAYDFAGRLASTTDAMGRRVEHEHYDDGLLKRSVLKNFRNPDGSTRDYVLEDNTYDGAGHLVQEVVDNGKTVARNTVDKLGRVLTAVLDPNGLNRANAFTYDGNGNVTSVTSTGKWSNVSGVVPVNEQKVTYVYDDADNLVEERVSDGTTTRVTKTGYDQRGLATSATDARGTAAGADPAAFTTRVSHDELGRPVTTTGAPVLAETGGQPATTVTPTVVTGYNTFGEPTEGKDELGNVSRAAYDRLGRPVSKSSPAYQAPGASKPITPTTTTKYDGNGNAVEVTDARGNTTRSAYDQLDRLTKLDQPASTDDERATTWFTYTRSGQLLSTVDPTGARTEATYDDLDRQVTATAVERRPVPGAFTTRVGYDDAGNVLTSALPSGATTTNTFDTLGQLIKSADPNDVRVEHGYDFMGRRVRTTDGFGRTAQSTYDLFGRKVAEATLKADGTVLRSSGYGYDPVGNLTTATDPLKQTSTYTYDAANRLVKQVEPVADGKSITTTSGYDAAGHRTRYTDGRGNATITTYNNLGLAESTTEPATAAHPNTADRTWTVGYDGNANPVSLTAPGGVTRQRIYDAANRPTDETGAGAEAETAAREIGYDLAGRLTSAGAVGGTNTYAYDDRGNLLSTTGPGGVAEFTYDPDGNTATREDAAGTASYGYTRSRLSSITDGLTGTAQKFTYDQAGAVKAIDYGAGRVRSLGYDDVGRLASDTLTNAGKRTVASIGYGYNPDDTVASETTAGLAGAGTTTYTYDHAARLTGVTAGGATTTYEWDDAGNRAKAAGRTATYDERNRLLSDGTSTYAYSARGGLRSKTTAEQTEQYSFDAFERMVSANGQTYGYDDLDRVATRGATRFTYAGLADEVVSDGVQSFARGPGDELVATARGTTERLTLSDAHGDVVAGFDPVDSALTALPDSTGYDPFGKVTARNGDTGALGFQGDWTDPATGRVDAGVRWYDPSTGGFSSRDTLDTSGGSASYANRYAYGAGDPVGYNDPTGHFQGPRPYPASPYTPTKPKAPSGPKGGKFGWVGIGLGMIWNVIKPTPLGDSSCTGRYGVTCDVYYSAGWQHQPSVLERFCDTHPWTNQCGGSGTRFYPPVGDPGTDASPGTGAGPGGGGGGGPTAEEIAAAARLAAYLRAKRISDQARAENEHAAKNTPIALPAGATAPVVTLPKLVSSSPSKPAAKLGTSRDVVKDAKAATDDIYQNAVRRVGRLVHDVSSAARVVVATVSSLGDPYSMRVTNARGGDCREQLPEPNYKPVDTARGGRATGVEACLTIDDLDNGKGTPASVNPPGMGWAFGYARSLGVEREELTRWINRCHLLGKQFGGSGSDLRNLSTCGRTANATKVATRDQPINHHMYNFEKKVEAALRSKQIVRYEVTPIYKGRRTVPVSYEMTAEGMYEGGAPGINMHAVVPNTIYSPKTGGRHNLGLIEDGGAPVPVGATP